MARDIIVVDTESTGLHDDAVILEVAAINMTTSEELSFAPFVAPVALSKAQPEALQINRYYERGVFKGMLDLSETSRCYTLLNDWLEGATLTGSNPTFDARLLSEVLEPSWHHRLLDLSAYAAGVLGLPPNELPGMHKVCELLGVVNEEEHSALGDARATAECFRILMES